MASSGGGSWIRTNRGIAACMAVLFAILLIYLLNQDWVYDKQRDGFHLGFFSVVGAIAMIVCCVSMMFDRLKSGTTPELASIRLAHIGHGVLALAMMGIYFILAWDVHFAQPWLRGILDVIPLTGEFILWTPIFMGAGMYLLGVRPAQSAAIAGVVVGIVIFGLFRIIGITLPSNFLLS